ncbi:MAG: hypothetical protein ABSE48_07590 [Verrucomicrobiota bacterium]
MELRNHQQWFTKEKEDNFCHGAEIRRLDVRCGWLQGAGRAMKVDRPPSLLSFVPVLIAHDSPMTLAGWEKKKTGPSRFTANDELCPWT